MTLPDSAFLPFTDDLRICRLLNGLWQVSGAHGAIQPGAALRDMLDYVEAGFITWDMADHYGPAEDFYGQLLRELRARRAADPTLPVQGFTKWVPRPARMTREIVEGAVNVSLRRMAVERLDVLQFHWWEYANPAYLEALLHLQDVQQAGRIGHLALTNFDTAHLRTITERGIRIVSNQVQYSLIDQRPAVQMAAYCQANNITLLTYGTLCGGLLSEHYLGQPEPRPAQLQTASLRKYKQMIDAWGGWALFQALLVALRQVAHKHSVSIANVATRFILDQPAVAGVIVGARLGLSHHRADNARVFQFALDAEDRQAINAVTQKSRDLFRLIGDCGDEYRR